MTRVAVMAMVALAGWAGTAAAQQPETFQQAREISARQGQPILVEFFRDG